MNVFQNNKVVLMGLGLYDKGSGISAARFLLGRCRELVITDLKSVKELRKGIASLRSQCRGIAFPRLLRRGSRRRLTILRGGAERRRSNPVATKIIWHLGGHRKEDFETADLVFQNPSVPADSPYLKIARERGIPIVNDWSIFLSIHQPKIFVGVTGTRGKSTTTALIYEMMKKKYKKIFLAGNIGQSPLTFIDSYRGEPIVAELSSWLLHHFSAVQKSPNIAVVTNIMKDHLDKYGGMKEYIADKENIFRFQKPGDVVVLNRDNPLCHSDPPAGGQNPKSKIIWFSLKKHLPKWVPLKKVKLVGEHNLANALAASAAAEAAGVSRRDIISVLKNFPGLPNRLELVRTVGGVKYYNDTTATTPDAAIAALETLGKTKIKNIILIAGGADKKLDYQKLAKNIKRYCKALILLPGTATQKIKLDIGYCPPAGGLDIKKARNMLEAVNLARDTASRGDIILLSPAAASFGLFRNEFERGEEFKKIVYAPFHPSQTQRQRREGGKD